MSLFAVKIKTAYTRIRANYAKRLLISNTFSTVLLNGAGDIICQSIECKLEQVKHRTSAIEGPKYKDVFFEKYDWTRSTNIAAIGLLTGPFGHFWYKWLDKKFSVKSFKNVCHLILYDQLVAAPIFNFLFIFFLNVFEGKQVLNSLRSFKEKFFTVYMYDCLIWPAAQMINFKFISPTYRLFYVNSLSLLWNSLLSYLLFNIVSIRTYNLFSTSRRS